MTRNLIVTKEVLLKYFCLAENPLCLVLMAYRLKVYFAGAVALMKILFSVVPIFEHPS